MIKHKAKSKTSHKNTIIVLVALIVCFSITSVVVLGTSPISRPSIPTSTNTRIKTIGSIAEIKAEDIQSGNYHVNKINNSSLCEDPTNLETLNVEITGEQLTELIKLYKPDDIPVKNVQVWFSEGRVYGAGSSGFILLPGEVRVIADIENEWYNIKQVIVGQISMNQAITSEVNSRVHNMFYKYLSSVYTNVDVVSFYDEKLQLQIESPEGLITVNQDEIIINNNLINEYRSKYRSCYGIKEESNDLTIQ